MESKLHERKQAVVLQAIYDAAIDLFAATGFDETTVEEVAQAAGVSRRTFFRYFDSKDDLLAYAVVSYSETLTEAVKGCSSEDSPLQVLTEIIYAASQLTEAAQARTRQVIKVSERSALARQAYQSRMIDVEDKLAQALAKHFREPSPYELRPKLLASLALSLLNAAVIAWYRKQYKDPSTAAQEVLKQVRQMLSEPASATSDKKEPLKPAADKPMKSRKSR